MPDSLRSEIASQWWVLEEDAGRYFNSLTDHGRWEIIVSFLQTSPSAALQSYIAQSDAKTLRDLAHLLLARSHALEAAA